jgi:sugar O-acyltransferase (sialic acid O-acetyltransferase NeuD family)
MAMAPIVVYGAGGHGREVAALLRDINRAEPRWEIAGFLDDGLLPGTERGGLGVLGGARWLEARPGTVHVALGVGSTPVKRRLVERLRGAAAGFPVLVHPTVVRGTSAAIGEGTQVAAGCVLTVDLSVGAFCTVNRLCTLSHDCEVGDYATLAPGVCLAGGVRVGRGADLGIGCTAIQGVEIGAWSIVGAGAAVVRDLPPDCTAVGVPARPIRTRPSGWHRG